MLGEEGKSNPEEFKLKVFYKYARLEIAYFNAVGDDGRMYEDMRTPDDILMEDMMMDDYIWM